MSDSKPIEVVRLNEESYVVKEEQNKYILSEDKNIEVVQIKEDSLVIVEDHDIYVVSVGSQGPRGPQGLKGDKGDKGDPGSSLASNPRVTIDVGSVDVIDSVNAMQIRSIKWMVTISKGGSFSHFEVMALNNGVDVNFVLYGIIGESLLYSIEVELVGDDMVLSVTNDEDSSIFVDSVRVGFILI